YTEMITTGALIHGDIDRHLAFSREEHPVALQLGGSEPAELAHCAKLGEAYGYDEINLNIGCPRERVRKGAFGACLMAEPELEADLPGLGIVINGGSTTWADITNQLAYVDGAMLGRAAYHNPWLLADPGKTRPQVVRAMYEYAKHVDSLRHVTRHMLGLYHGHKKARLWRRLLSDAERLRPNRAELLLEALEAVETPGYTEFVPA